MITAVDTSVLLDVLGADATFGAASREALRDCRRQGGLIACDVVWAETGAWFGSVDDASDAFGRIGLRFDAIDADVSLQTAAAWRAYRRRGGTRRRVIGDFLVGAHAAARADRLLTRDRGFYRSQFKGLEILDPGDAR